MCALESIEGKYFSFRKGGVQQFSHPAGSFSTNIRNTEIC